MIIISLKFFFVMKLRPPRSTRTNTLFPYTTLFLSDILGTELRMKADMDNKFEKVEEIACSMRDIFERILEDSIGTADPTGACLYASILLSTTLEIGRAHV